MENAHFMALSQYVVGLMTCQNLLLQYLIKKGIINKTEISNAKKLYQGSDQGNHLT